MQWILNMIKRKERAIREIERQDQGRIAVRIPEDLHPATAALVADFSEAMAKKLRISELKYGYSNGWQSKEWMDECREKLRDHLEKGDPIDVANYCAFLWFHNQSTKEEQ